MSKEGRKGGKERGNEIFKIQSTKLGCIFSLNGVQREIRCF